MTTLNTQLVRMQKVLAVMEDKSHPSIIPPQLLRETRGIMFFKKIARGKQTAANSQGLFMRRKGDKWSQPVAIQIQNSDLYWGNAPRVDRSDVFILIQNEELVDNFGCFGQIGFDDNSSNKMKKGVCIENSELSFLKFATVLSERPDLVDGAAFSYGLFNGHFFPVHLESPIFQFRESSNAKFYLSSRDLDLPRLLQQGVVIADVSKCQLIGQVHALLGRHFDVRKRFPEYADAGESPTRQPESASASPDPASSSPLTGASSSSDGPAFGRQWSSSTCSSQGSDSDADFQGYVPRASDLSSNWGSARGADLAAAAERPPTLRAWESEEPHRTRATSFDFSA